MATAAQEAQLEALFVLLADSRSTNSFALAGLTLLVLEHIANLDFEIQHIWKTRLSWSNVFYIWIRYFTLISVGICVGTLITTHSSDQFCHKFLYAQSVILSVVVVSADLVLVARVWILYRRSRILLWILLPLVAVELVGILVVSLLQVGPLQEYIHAGPLLTGCYSVTVPRLFVAYSIPPMVVAFVMFVMTLYKCATTMVIMGPGRTPLIAMFLRDGVVWFIIVLACCVMEFVIWSRARPSLLQLVITPTTAIMGCCGARVLRNIKFAVTVDHIHGSGTLGPTSATMTIGSDPVRLPVRRGQVDSEPWYLKSSTPGM